MVVSDGPNEVSVSRRISAESREPVAVFRVWFKVVRLSTVVVHMFSLPLSQSMRFSPLTVLFSIFTVVLSFAPATAVSESVAYEFVVDLSGSMNRYVSGRSLRSHAIDALNAALPDGSSYAVRVFGHRVPLHDKERGCADTELLFPLGVHPREEVARRLSGLAAIGLTPLAESLGAVEQDLGSAVGKRIVVLLSDGADSCGGNPAAELERLRGKGIEVIVNPIGLGVDKATRAQLAELASISGGKFSEIKDLSALPTALSAALGHLGVAPKPRKLPGDLEGERDAGDSLSDALPVSPGDWLKGSIGAKRGALEDRVDTFSFAVTSGEKEVVEIEGLGLGAVSAEILDSAGNLLGRIASSPGESEPITAPIAGGVLVLRITAITPGEVRYRFRAVPLVKIN